MCDKEHIAHVVGGGRVSENKDIIQCTYCLRTYLGKQSFNYHLKVFKCPKSPHIETSYPRQCMDCLKYLSTKQSYSKHIQNCMQHNKAQSPNLIDEEIKNSTSHTCDDCFKSFYKLYNLKRHKKVCTVRDTIVPMNCQKCGQNLSDKSVHFKHSCTLKTETNPLQFSKDHCNSHTEKLDEDGWTNLHFNSMNAFHVWLESENLSTFTSFKKLTGTKVLKSSYKYHYYSCQFYTTPHSKSSRTNLTIRKNKKGTIPSDLKCPVRLNVCEHQTGEVSLKYFHLHNHNLKFENLLYQPLQQSIRDLIKFHLRNSVPVPKIQSILINEIGERENRDLIISKEITRKNIQAYQRRITNAKYPQDDSTAVLSYVEELTNEKYNPILIFKLQNCKTKYGPFNLDFLVKNSESSFALGLQTKEQMNMLQNATNEMIFIDATHKTNQYDFYLITIITPDEFGHGYPVAHFITNYFNFETMVCLFNSLKVRMPNLNVNCVMTDDDQVLFKAFTHVFGASINHLLCKWHILESWKRQLNQKIPDAELRKEVRSKLMQLLNEESLKEFQNLLYSFLREYHVKCQTFIDYFYDTYCGRCHLWAMSHRKFPHAASNTNNFCESFHNQLKTVFLKRKFNRRLHSLITVLLDMEKDYFLKHSYRVKNHIPPKPFTQSIKMRHDKSRKIHDGYVEKYFTKVWFVKSQTAINVFYLVEQLNDQCPLPDFCFYRCTEIACLGLCSHLYRCTCPDNNLCKHIHKVHSFSIKDNISYHPLLEELNDEVNPSAIPQICNSNVNVCNTYTPRTNAQKLETCEKLCSELLHLVKNPKVQTVMLKNVITSLNGLVASCRGVLNSNNSIDNHISFPRAKVSPNQKLIRQNNSIFKTRKSQTKRHRKKNCLINFPLLTRTNVIDDRAVEITDSSTILSNSSCFNSSIKRKKYCTFRDSKEVISSKMNTKPLHKRKSCVFSDSEEDDSATIDSTPIQKQKSRVFSDPDENESTTIVSKPIKKLKSCVFSDSKVGDFNETNSTPTDCITLSNHDLIPKNCNYSNKEKIGSNVIQTNSIYNYFSPLLKGESNTNNNSGTITLQTISSNTNSFTSEINISEANSYLKKISNHSISVGALKSLDPFISEAEEIAIKSVFPDFVCGWLFDEIVNRFLSMLCVDRNDFSFIDSSVSYLLSVGLTTQGLPTSSEFVFIPFCLSGDHWILFFVNQNEKRIDIFNPSKYAEENGYKNLTATLINAFNKNLNYNGKWKIDCPPHAFQNDGINCGVFVCYYAYQLVQGNDLNIKFDTVNFRKFIFNSILMEKISFSEEMQMKDSVLNCSNKNDALQCIVKINKIEITEYMLKSLDLNITQEEDVLKSVSSSFRKGCLYDSIIDAFLFKFTHKSTYFKSVDSILSKSVFESKVHTFSWVKELAKFKMLFIPVNFNSHWMLIVADICGKSLEFLDPLDKPISINCKNVLQHWCFLLQEITQTNHWLLKTPNHVHQTDDYNCGVFICFYVHQKILNAPLTELFNIKQFRGFIQETLLNE